MNETIAVVAIVVFFPALKLVEHKTMLGISTKYMASSFFFIWTANIFPRYMAHHYHELKKYQNDYK